MKFVYWTIAALVIFVAVLFAISNRHMVALSLWPVMDAYEMPAFVLGLGAFGAGFLCGAFMFWLRALSARARARMSERKAERLQHDIEDLREHEAHPDPQPPATAVVAPRGDVPQPIEKPAGAG